MTTQQITVLDVDEAIRQLEAIVAEKGEDYIYAKAEVAGTDQRYCAYVDKDGNPSCIVGHVLARLGVKIDPEQFSLNTQDTATALYDYRSDWLAERGVQLTKEASVVLRTAQVVQDDEGSWGDALAQARHHAQKFTVNPF